MSIHDCPDGLISQCVYYLMACASKHSCKPHNFKISVFTKIFLVGKVLVVYNLGLLIWTIGRFNALTFILTFMLVLMSVRVVKWLGHIQHVL